MAVSVPKRLGIGAFVLLGTFLLGYVPASLTARDARAEQERLTQQLMLTGLEVQLGMMSYEANRDNYGLAAQLATPFFDAVRGAIARPASQDTASSLQAVIARRDEITSDLARANPVVKGKLAQLYADCFRLTQTPGAAQPTVSR
jgi:hypothetical protein